MAKSKRRRDPIPDEFPNWREAARFWDNHDTEDYAEYWHPIKEEIEFAEAPRLQVKLSSSVARELQVRAKKMKVSVEILVNRLLEETIDKEIEASGRVAEGRADYARKRYRKKSMRSATR